MNPSVNVVEVLSDDQTIGTVERFGSNNTRTIRVRTKNLLEWAALVHANNGEEWTEVAVTPNYPLAAYPQNDDDTGIALAPGLYPEDYQDLKEGSD